MDSSDKVCIVNLISQMSLASQALSQIVPHEFQIVPRESQIVPRENATRFDHPKYLTGRVDEQSTVTMARVTSTVTMDFKRCNLGGKSIFSFGTDPTVDRLGPRTTTFTNSIVQMSCSFNRVRAFKNVDLFVMISVCCQLCQTNSDNPMEIRRILFSFFLGLGSRYLTMSNHSAHRSPSISYPEQHAETEPSTIK